MFWLCWVFVAAQGLSLITVSGGYSLVGVLRLLIEVASLAVEHGLQGTRASVVAFPRLQSTGSIVVAHGRSCFTACGIFPDQGLNPCLLHWQTDSLPLTHHGSHPYFNRTLIFRTILDLLQY